MKDQVEHYRELQILVKPSQRMVVKGSLKPMKGTLRGREWRSMKDSGKGQE